RSPTSTAAVRTSPGPANTPASASASGSTSAPSSRRAGQSLALAPVEFAADDGAGATAGPDFAGRVYRQFDDRVVSDLAALADAIEAAVARKRIARRQPGGQGRIGSTRGSILETGRRADEGTHGQVIDRIVAG